MHADTRRQNVITELPGYDPEIGRWLWALEDGRRRTKDTLAGMDERAVDWVPAGRGDGIGTILYHLALIEADWLYVEILGQAAYPPDVIALLAHPDRDARGHLTQVKGLSLAAHLARLDAIRRRLLTGLRGMAPAEFRRPRRL